MRPFSLNIVSHKELDKMSKRLKLSSGLSFFIFLAMFHLTAAASDLTFYVTDFGIWQYKAALKTGDNFGQSNSCVFPNLPQESQVLIVMPPHEEMVRMSDEQIKQVIFDGLKKRVDSGTTMNVKTYELQIIQHIGPWTYPHNKHQVAVNRFARCAYAAIGKLNDHLRETCHQSAEFHGIFGSNGTKAFSESIAAWHSYMKDAVFFDGRAFKTAMIETIKTLGAKNVRIFNTAGDLPAPNFPWIRSIGNHDVVKQLKSRFPALTVGWIDPLDRLDFMGNGHLAAMQSDPTPRFLIKFWNGNSYTKPAKMSSEQLFPYMTARETGKEAGVSMQMVVNDEALQEDETGKLDVRRNNILKNRTRTGSLSWPLSRKEDNK
jgi:hypothetical protein